MMKFRKLRITKYVYSLSTTLQNIKMLSSNCRIESTMFSLLETTNKVKTIRSSQDTYL